MTTAGAVLAQLLHKGLIEALLLLSLGAKNNPSTEKLVADIR